MAGGICGKGELLVGLAEAYQCWTRKWMVIVLCAKNQNGCLFVLSLKLIHGAFEKLRISLVELSDFYFRLISPDAYISILIIWVVL